MAAMMVGRERDRGGREGGKERKRGREEGKEREKGRERGRERNKGEKKTNIEVISVVALMCCFLLVCSYIAVLREDLVC